MLQLSGNSEVAFAEKDSIQAAPIVYVEWNYNNIERPYIVSSTFNGNIDANGNLLVASSWVSTASVYEQNAGTGTGLYSTTDTTASAILLNTGTSNTATLYASLNAPQVNVSAMTAATANITNDFGVGGNLYTNGKLTVTGATTLTGILKGTGTTAFVAATAGTDYSAGTSALATGILKSTTTTGALSIAVAGDFPTLNQNTTGTVAGDILQT